MKRQQNQPALFIDFDGTITRKDVIDLILENFADERWLEIEKQWRAGRIGSRDCLRGQMALVRATREEFNELIDSIEVDEGFALLLEVCARHKITAHIISDGFDYCIRRILERPQLQLAHLLSSVRVCSSQLEYDRHSHWHLKFPYFTQTCAHGCATCKPGLMRLLNREGAPAIFVGDGLSDRYAAAEADLVFAKNGLAAYCRQQEIEYLTFDELDEVAGWLIEASPFDSSSLLNRFEALSA